VLQKRKLTERPMVTKIILSRCGHSPKNGLLWKQESICQRGLRDCPAWPCIGALPCNRHQPLATRRRDELGVANSNVTTEVTDQTCPQHSACPARGARGEQGALSASS
jgi:hypothetical protein